MLKRTIIFILSFSILMSQTQAATGSQSIKEAIDEFTFATTVEWNQKDPTFIKQEFEKLALKIKEMEAQGITRTQISDELISQIKEKKTATEFRKILSLLEQGKMDSKESTELILSHLQKTYNLGASFRGMIPLIIAADVVVLGLSVMLIFFMAGYRIYDGDVYCIDFYPCDLFM